MRAIYMRPSSAFSRGTGKRLGPFKTNHALTLNVAPMLEIVGLGSPQRLRRNGFCLFGKQNKSGSPRSCTSGKRYRDAKAAIFCRSDRWEGTTGLKKNRARRDISRLGSPT